MNWIYLSPHFDDIALSCGGLLWEQVQAGQTVSLWTVCAGDPPEGALSAFAQSLHDRWETPIAATHIRRQEDQASCHALGTAYRYFPYPDCIYRGPAGGQYYASEEAIFGEIHPDEAALVEELADQFRSSLPQQAEIVCPMTLGGHVDHRLTRAAAEVLGHGLWYYADYPYVLKVDDLTERLKRKGWQDTVFPISQDGLCAWQLSIEAHASQLSTFWANTEAMRAAIQTYCQDNSGVRLWKPIKR